MSMALERLGVKLKADLWGADDRNARKVEFDGGAYCGLKHVDLQLDQKLAHCQSGLLSWLHSTQLHKDETIFLLVAIEVVLVNEDDEDVPGSTVHLSFSEFPKDIAAAIERVPHLCQHAAQNFLKHFAAAIDS